MVINISVHKIKGSYKDLSNKNDLFQKGFSLIEIMIVIVIIALISAIAIPSYNEYVLKANRSEMMGELQNIANKIDSKKLTTGKYNNILLSDIFSGPVLANGTSQYPLNKPLYTVSVNPLNATNNGLGGTNWTITAIPISGQIMDGDGNLSINFEGLKCHDVQCSKDDGWKK